MFSENRHQSVAERIIVKLRVSDRRWLQCIPFPVSFDANQIGVSVAENNLVSMSGTSCSEASCPCPSFRESSDWPRGSGLPTRGRGVRHERTASSNYWSSSYGHVACERSERYAGYIRPPPPAVRQ